MTINNTISIIMEPLAHTSFYGAEYLIPIAAVFIICAMITKDLHKWKTLALPVAAMLHSLGITQHYLFIIASVLSFGMTNLSMSVAGNILQAAAKTTMAATAKIGKTAGEVYRGGKIEAEKIKKQGAEIWKGQREKMPTKQNTSPVFYSQKGAESAAIMTAIKEAKSTPWTTATRLRKQGIKKKKDKYLEGERERQKLKARYTQLNADIFTGRRRLKDEEIKEIEE